MAGFYFHPSHRDLFLKGFHSLRHTGLRFVDRSTARPGSGGVNWTRAFFALGLKHIRTVYIVKGIEKQWPVFPSHTQGHFI